MNFGVLGSGCGSLPASLPRADSPPRVETLLVSLFGAKSCHRYSPGQLQKERLRRAHGGLRVPSAATGLSPPARGADRARPSRPPRAGLLPGEGLASPRAGGGGRPRP